MNDSQRQTIIVQVDIYSTHDVRPEDISVMFTTPQGGTLIKQAGPVGIKRKSFRQLHDERDKALYPPLSESEILQGNL